MGVNMKLDKKGVYAFRLKAGQSEITIPFEIFIGVTSGIILIGLLKVIRNL
jgi:uncharacterized protein YegP (UPF0339 family)